MLRAVDDAGATGLGVAEKRDGGPCSGMKLMKATNVARSLRGLAAPIIFFFFCRGRGRPEGDNRGS